MVKLHNEKCNTASYRPGPLSFPRTMHGNEGRIWEARAGGGPMTISSSPRLCVSVGIPAGGLGAGISNGVGRSGGVVGGSELSMPGQIPQPGWAAGSVPRSRLSIRRVARGPCVGLPREPPDRAAGAARRAAWPDFCDPHPPQPPSDQLSRGWRIPGKGTKPRMLRSLFHSGSLEWYVVAVSGI